MPTRSDAASDPMSRTLRRGFEAHGSSPTVGVGALASVGGTTGVAGAKTSFTVSRVMSAYSAPLNEPPATITTRTVVVRASARVRGASRCCGRASRAVRTIVAHHTTPPTDSTTTATSSRVGRDTTSSTALVGPRSTTAQASAPPLASATASTPQPIALRRVRVRPAPGSTVPRMVRPRARASPGLRERADPPAGAESDATPEVGVPSWSTAMLFLPAAGGRPPFSTGRQPGSSSSGRVHRKCGGRAQPAVGLSRRTASRAGRQHCEYGVVVGLGVAVGVLVVVVGSDGVDAPVSAGPDVDVGVGVRAGFGSAMPVRTSARTWS